MRSPVGPSSSSQTSSPRAEHGVVQRGIPDVLADPVALEMLGHHGGQDPDGDDPGVQLGRLVGGAVERLAQVRLQLERGIARQGTRMDVELDVVPRQLGLVVRVRDLLEHRLVVELGPEVLRDEVELDLEPGHRAVELELAVSEHALEHVEISTHLLAVLLTLLACVPGLFDVGSHGTRQPHSGTRREGLTRVVQPSNTSGGGHEQTRLRSP
jgi:hypothetical protein